MSKITWIITGCFCLILAFIVFLGQDVSNVTEAQQIEKSFIPSKVQVQQLKFEQLPEPEGLIGYNKSEYKGRYAIVKALQSEEQLSSDQLVFLKNELVNESNHEVLRNLIANVLTNQAEQDPYLYLYFAKMIENESLSMTWREYSLQFLGKILPYSADPEFVQAILEDWASRIDQEAAGTAQLQLAFQEEHGHLQLGEDYTELQVESLKQQDIDLKVKLSTLAIMGKRKDPEALPSLRKYAQKLDAPHEQRVAIAALGNYTKEQLTAADIAMLEGATKADHELVQIAATTALARIRGE